MLRGLIKEAIQSREPGSPLWSPEPERKRTRKTEAFGPYDASKKFTNYPHDPDKDPPMQHVNFENAHHEAFLQALNPAIEELINTSHEIFEAEWGPEQHGAWNDIKAEFDSDVQSISENMREDLLSVVSEYLKKVNDLI